METIETLVEIRSKYNFWNEKERPYYEALSEAIRVLNAQKDKCHYAKIVRCKDCKYNGRCMYQDFVKDNSIVERTMDDFFCPDGDRKET